MEVWSGRPALQDAREHIPRRSSTVVPHEAIGGRAVSAVVLLLSSSDMLTQGGRSLLLVERTFINCDLTLSR